MLDLKRAASAVKT